MQDQILQLKQEARRYSSLGLRKRLRSDEILGVNVFLNWREGYPDGRVWIMIGRMGSGDLLDEVEGNLGIRCGLVL